MSKYSSFKSHQLITENWRKFLNEGIGTSGVPAFATLRNDLNALWVRLRDEGALPKIMTTAKFEAAGIDTKDLWAVDELSGIRWSRTGGDDENPEYAPDDPADVAAIEAEEAAIDATRTPHYPHGAERGKQIGLPGFEQE